MSIEQMTYDLIKKVDGKVDKIQEDLTDVKVEAEKTNGKMHVMDLRVRNVEDRVASLQNDFENHEDDDEVHYNHGIANETPLQKAKRNAVPYAVVGTGTGTGLYLLFELIKWLIANWPGS